MQLTRRQVHRFHDRQRCAAVLDDAAADVGEARVARCGLCFVVGNDRVVHEVRDRAAAVRVEPEREDAEHVRLQVVHEEAPDDVGVADTRAQQQARRLERATGDDDVPGADLAGVAVGADRSHAAGLARRAVEHDVGDDRVRPNLALAGAQCLAERRDRVALRLDRATEERAETAVVARGTAVVLDAVDAGRCSVRVVPELRRRLRGERRAVHVRARRHRIRVGAPRSERVRGVVTGDADDPLGLGVVRLELVVVERPVDDVGTLERAELGAHAEVDLAKARQLAVSVEAPAADRRRQVVDGTGPDPVAVGFSPAVGARLEQGIGTEEVPELELQLVVADVPERPVRLVEREEVVRALLEHDDRPPALGEHLGRGRSRGARADDDRVAVGSGHASRTGTFRSSSRRRRARRRSAPPCPRCRPDGCRARRGCSSSGVT